MNHLKIAFLTALSGFLLYATVDGKAEDASESTPLTLQLVRGVEHIQRSLAVADSIEFHAALTVTESDELLKVMPGLKDIKVTHWQLDGLCANEEAKFAKTLVDAPMNGVSSRKYYIAKDNVTIVNLVGNSATVVPIDGKKESAFPPGVGGPLLLFGFLHPSVDELGIRALTPEILSSKDAWAPLLATLRKVKVVMEGTIPTITMERENDVIIVGFTRSPYAEELWPSELAVKNKKGGLIAKVRVIEFLKDPALPGIPKMLSMETYAAPETDPTHSIHLATWNYDVAKLSVGGAIDKDELSFDPSSVREIWDKGVHIVVPR